MDIDGLLTTAQAAAYLGWGSVQVLWNTARRDPTFPRPIKIGRTSLYDPAALDEWRKDHPARQRPITPPPGR